MHTYETLGRVIIQELINIRIDFKNEIERLGDRLEKCMCVQTAQDFSTADYETNDHDVIATPVSKSQNLVAAAAFNACIDNSEELKSREYNVVKVEENLEDAYTTVEVELTDFPHSTESNNVENSLAFLPEVQKEQAVSFLTASVSGEEKTYSLSDEKKKVEDRPCSVDNFLYSHSNISMHSLHRKDGEEFASYPTQYVTESTSKKFINEHVEKYECKICKRFFSTKLNLKYHSQTHSGIKSNAGAFNTSKLSRKLNMDRHNKAKLLSGEKSPFVTLATSELIHRGKKLFVCDICRKTFTRKSDMGRHMRLHTGETPFACLECGKKFRRSDSLRNHMRVHNRNKTKFLTGV